jgi:hypothetical protein
LFIVDPGGQAIKLMQWSKVVILTPILVIAAISINEILLHVAKHEPSVVDDADLFCDIYVKVRDLGTKDVIFLGASRMQTGIDLATFTERYPDRKALLLAQSGKGTSYPLFKEIVEKSNYRGTIIIDETEKSLSSQDNTQLTSVKHCTDNFSVNRQLNRSISTWLQSHLTFLNPQSSSFRLWGNLISQRRLPVPYYVKTLGDRQQLSDFARADSKALQLLRDSRLPNLKQKSSIEVLPSFEMWFARSQHWQPLIRQFQQRGGKVVFVRMPVAPDLWKFERKIYPPKLYWKPWAKKMNVKSIHFSDYSNLSNFELPDTSHLDMRDKPAFTKNFLKHLNTSL